jgi:hypothetical protein
VTIGRPATMQAMAMIPLDALAAGARLVGDR